MVCAAHQIYQNVVGIDRLEFDTVEIKKRKAVRFAIRRPHIDRRRAARLLCDAGVLLLAALPFLVGLLAGLLLRLAAGLWWVLLWVLGAVLAGYDAGRGVKR